MTFLTFERFVRALLREMNRQLSVIRVLHLFDAGPMTYDAKIGTAVELPVVLLFVGVTGNAAF